jgi:hypothetical protein
MVDVIDSKARSAALERQQRATFEAEGLALGAKMKVILQRMVSQGSTPATAAESDAVLGDIRDLITRYRRSLECH